VNSLAALHFSEVFGRHAVFQLPTSDDAPGKAEETQVSRGLRGRLLFGLDQTYDELARRFRRGAVVKATSLSEEFDFEAFKNHYGEGTVVLFVIDGETLKVATAGERTEPKKGQTVLALVDPVESR